METGCNYYSTPTGVLLEKFKRNLGKVVPTPCGTHDRFKHYERLSLVRDEHTLVAYISKQCVPEGVEITNREYWQPMNVVGYADGGIIILKDIDHTGQFITYTLEEAVKSVAEVSRKPGALLSFLTQDEEGAVHWEIWQYNNINNYEWENLEHWRSVYNDVSKFIGWYNDLDELLRVYVGTYTGKYAIVGEELRDAAIYEGRSDGWYKLDDNPYEKFMHDLIYQILNGTLDLTDEEKAAFKAFMCGGETDDCGEFGCCDDGVGPAGRAYTKFKVRTDLPETTFDLHIAYPEPHYANNGHEITWEAAQLVDLDFDFISGTWYERKNKGISIDADEELNLGSCFIELRDGDTGEDLSSIKMSVDRGDEYVYNSEENPWYKTYTRTEIIDGQEVEVTKEGIFLPCDGQYHFVAFSKLSKDEPDMDVYNMKFIIDNTHTEDADIKLRYYRKDVNPASCYTSHSYKYLTVTPNEYYEGMTESQILDWETNTEVNEATEQIIGCFNSRLAGVGFEVTVTSGDVAAIVLDRIYYEGNEAWCDAHGLTPTEEEDIKGYIFIRLIYAEPETKYAYTIKNLTDYDVYVNVNGIEDKRIKANWYYEFDRYEDIHPIKITSGPITVNKEGQSPVVYDWVINNIVTTEATLRYGKAYITLRPRTNPDDDTPGDGGSTDDTHSYKVINNTNTIASVSVKPREGSYGETLTKNVLGTSTFNMTYDTGTMTVNSAAPENYRWMLRTNSSRTVEETTTKDVVENDVVELVLDYTGTVETDFGDKLYVEVWNNTNDWNEFNAYGYWDQMNDGRFVATKPANMVVDAGTGWNWGNPVFSNLPIHVYGGDYVAPEDIGTDKAIGKNTWHVSTLDGTPVKLTKTDGHYDFYNNTGGPITLYVRYFPQGIDVSFNDGSKPTDQMINETITFDGWLDENGNAVGGNAHVQISLNARLPHYFSTQSNAWVHGLTFTGNLYDAVTDTSGNILSKSVGNVYYTFGWDK